MNQDIAGAQHSSLLDIHRALGARYTKINEIELVAHYGDIQVEYRALRDTAGVLDFSFRGRLCLTGADRTRFLNGQVTNDVNVLRAGEGCYAALVTAKARMQSDLNIYCLENELLLEFEPGLTETVAQRLEKYIIADDVQVVNVAADYGMFSVQGPKAVTVVNAIGLSQPLPAREFSFIVERGGFGELYVMNRPRLGVAGFDLFVPVGGLGDLFRQLATAVRAEGGAVCGWEAFERVRIEAGIPRFGADMDDTIIPLEAGLADSAISFKKGCYIGQEIISRICTYSEVAKSLRRLRFEGELKSVPVKGEKLFHSGKEAGYVTSAVNSPALNATVGMGYVRKEVNQIDTQLTLPRPEGEVTVRIIPGQAT